MATQAMMNRYDGVMENEVVGYAIRRMKQLGFRPHEWEDLLQNLAIEILAFQFQPAKSNGARRTTVLCAIINNQLVSMLRSRARYQKRLELLTPQELCEDHVEVRADVRLTLAGLTPRQQRVCTGLLEGLSVCQIARDMNCGRTTVRRMVKQIRRHFERIGLDGWVR